MRISDSRARVCRRAQVLDKIIWLVAVACLLALASPFSLVFAGDGKVDLTELSLEDLMNVEVSSVSKKAEPISEAAAAIYVLTADDIRRSGAMTIPDALRMVPGVHVAQIDANKWAVTARGFNGVFANKLLVLIDGRSVYTPLYSGVYWDVQDVLLDDIERIEVIRGPGATLWGANAVNGVINILSKSSVETQGVFGSATAGSLERPGAELRFGSSLNENLSYRFNVKGFNRSGFRNLGGDDAADDWNMLRGGGRADWKINSSNDLSIQGDIYSGKAGTDYRYPKTSYPYYSDVLSTATLRGGDVLTRWVSSALSRSLLTMELYYDQTERDDPAAWGEVRRTVNFDLQHDWSASNKTDVVWGAGYRYSHGRLSATEYASGVSDLGTNLFSAFVQTTVKPFPNRLALTAGSKLEHNDFTGTEIQPSLRALWTVGDNHSVWGSVSKAVRTPSQGEREAQLWLYVIPPLTLANPTEAAMKIVYTGSQDFNSEVVLSWETGYRGQLTNRLWFDAAAYYNKYDDIIGALLGSPQAPDAQHPYITIPFTPDNSRKASSQGIEIAIDYQASQFLRAKFAYTFADGSVTQKDGGGDKTPLQNGKFLMPRNQASLLVMFNPVKRFELSTWARYADKIADIDIPSYGTLDARLAFDVTKQITVSAVGKDLLQKEHLEFKPDLHSSTSDVERRFYTAVTWKF